ncbi:Cdc4 and related F-box and WD-40 proteins [Phaffia rhodozyma]|uniref:Cdc4 and related F-box and WD-40 proteins n=1 Tax=Phaffia rhodozyma TaxID=264483 RepID=A0A0F7SN30_PHARH|nr:Cdc4 and related F-box and WD-40 proteins [Phaffia rhodozyma]
MNQPLGLDSPQENLSASSISSGHTPHTHSLDPADQHDTLVPHRSKGKAREPHPTINSRKENPRRTWGDHTASSDDGSQDGEILGGPIVQTSPLLNLPSETLLHIVSFLPPSSLLDILRTCRALNAAISDEASWKASFERTFVRPGLAGLTRSCLPGGGSGQGWRKEALARERLIDVVSNSNTASLLYDPRLSYIHSFAVGYPLPAPKTPSYQFRAPTLLSASIAMGVCTRSNPMTGTLVKGYLDSQGSNDHTLWSIPQTRPTALLLSPRDPSTVLWGFQDGQVAQTSIIAGSGRTPTLTARSRGVIGHDGPVWSLVFGPPGFFISGGQDGRVKLWAESTGDHLICLWTSEQPVRKKETSTDGAPPRPSLGPEYRAVSHVCWDAASGVVASVTEAGLVRVWRGVFAPSEGNAHASTSIQPSSITSWQEDRDRFSPGQTPMSFCLDVVDPCLIDKRDQGKIPLTVNVLLRISGRPSFQRITFQYSLPLTDGGIDKASEAASTTLTTFSPSSAEGFPELTTLFAEFKVPPPPSLPFHSTPSVTPSEPSTPSGVPDPMKPQVFHLATSTILEKRVNTRGSLASNKFVVAGDAEGMVRIWDWDVDEKNTEVLPLRSWRAADGKVTALECQQGLVVVGSLEGIVKIWDPLQEIPLLLHELSECAPANRRIAHHLQAGALDPDLFRVSNVVLERDLLICSIGTKILSWRIGRRIRRNGKSPFVGKIIGRSGNGWEGRLTPGKAGHQSPSDLKHEIANAQAEHSAESRNLRETIERERAQKEKFMGQLGLTDEEVVAYALMLSQEEEEQQSSRARDRSEKNGEEGYVNVEEEEEEENDRLLDEMDTTVDSDAEAEDLRLALERSLLDGPTTPDFDPVPSSTSSVPFSTDRYDSSLDYSSPRPFLIPAATAAAASMTRHAHSTVDNEDEWPAMTPSSVSPTKSLLSSSKGKKSTALSIPSLNSNHSSNSTQAGEGRENRGRWGGREKDGQRVLTAAEVLSGKPRSSPLVSPIPSPDFNSAYSSGSNMNGKTRAGAENGDGKVKTLTREEREEEELRLVLEMSLVDQ